MHNSGKYLQEFINLRELAEGFMSSRIFLTALDLNVFEAINNKASSSDQVAQKLGTDSRAIEIILNALVSMGVLKKKNNLFLNIDKIAQLLMPSSPNYCGGAFRNYLNSWDAWSDLTTIVRTGKISDRVRNDSIKLGLYTVFKERAEEYAPRLIRLIDCHNAKTMLDLGGGSGSYSIAFTKHYLHLKSILFDKGTIALRIATEEIRKHHLQDRIILKRGDFFSDNLGNGFDLVLLSSIICLFGEEKVLLLFNRIKKVLNENGRIVIWDVIIDESKTKPASAAMFAVHMLINSPSGRLYSPSEVTKMLVLAGFEDIYHVPLGQSKVIIGYSKSLGKT